MENIVKNRTARPQIRRCIRLDLHEQVAGIAQQEARRRGLALPEYVERLMRQDLARDTAERLVPRPLRPPIATVPWMWLRRRPRRLLDTASRTRRPVIVKGRMSLKPKISDLRGRDRRQPRPLGIRDGVVLLPIRQGARCRLGRWFCP